MASIELSSIRGYHPNTIPLDGPTSQQLNALVRQAQSALEDPDYGRTIQPYTSVQRLGNTALTDLFAQRYKVRTQEITQGQLSPLRLVVRPVERIGTDFSLYYHRTYPNGDSRIFWTMTARKGVGEVQMYTHGLRGARPLKGSGNVIAVPGVLDALATDLQTLQDRQYPG